jgi:hypothetical protein
LLEDHALPSEGVEVWRGSCPGSKKTHTVGSGGI